MKMIFAALIALTMFARCASNDVEPNRDTLLYFQQHLKADMNFETLTTTFGPPADDIGSGIRIYVYNLEDNTKILIGFVDKVLYARQMDQNNQLLLVLI